MTNTGTSTSNMTGKVMTVNGPIDPSEVGTCIMHEHLFIDFWRDKEPGYNAPATDVAHWNEKLTLENLHLARSRKPIKDNFLLTDERVTINDVMAFRNLGGKKCCSYFMSFESVGGGGKDGRCIRALFQQ